MNGNTETAMPCLLDLWGRIENSLYYWLRKQTHDNELAFDVLQETFLRALQMNRSFCDIENQKAWLYRVANNLLVDEWRKQHRLEPLDINAFSEQEETDSEFLVVDSLAQCLPKALACLSDEDRDVIEYCDLHGHSQQEFSNLRNLAISTVKSRIQRARVKLSHHLKTNCQIRFDENNRVCCFIPQSNESVSK